MLCCIEVIHQLFHLSNAPFSTSIYQICTSPLASTNQDLQLLHLSNSYFSNCIYHTRPYSSVRFVIKHLHLSNSNFTPCNRPIRSAALALTTYVLIFLHLSRPICTSTLVVSYFSACIYPI